MLLFPLWCWEERSTQPLHLLLPKGKRPFWRRPCRYSVIERKRVLRPVQRQRRRELAKNNPARGSHPSHVSRVQFKLFRSKSPSLILITADNMQGLWSQANALRLVYFGIVSCQVSNHCALARISLICWCLRRPSHVQLAIWPSRSYSTMHPQIIVDLGRPSAST
jgi:hypothetical protein